MTNSLKATLERLRHVRMSRGRGARALGALLRRVHAGEVEMDQETEAQLGEILASLHYALDDAQHAAQQNLRVTGRTIGEAIRRGGR